MSTIRRRSARRSCRLRILPRSCGVTPWPEIQPLFSGDESVFEKGGILPGDEVFFEFREDHVVLGEQPGAVAELVRNTVLGRLLAFGRVAPQLARPRQMIQHRTLTD